MRTAIPLTVLATALACSLASTPANARARVFVASYGDDGNPCTFLSPCRNFQAAINAVDAGGEVTAIDSAGFGTVSINKSVIVTSPAGVEAGIAVGSGATGISINLPSDLDTVTLHGLTIEGDGVAATGIAFTGHGALNVLDCVVGDMTGTGISFTPLTGGTVVIADTTAANNNTNGVFVAANGSGVQMANLSHVKLINNGPNSGGSGFKMTAAATAIGVVSIDSSLIAQNGVGLTFSESVVASRFR
jgi:hypothetical protein